jgi:hypothetical protein
MIMWRRPRIVVAVPGAAVALAVVLSGCTIGNQPPIGMANPRVQGGSLSGRPVARHTGPVPIGIDLNVVSNNEPDSVISSLGRQDIRYMADVLHVNEIGIDFSVVDPSLTSDEVTTPSGVTPSVSAIKSLTEIAKSYKLRVQYRILFWIQGTSSTKLKPADINAWFANLQTAETPYLQLAQQEGVSEFVAGTEKTGVEHAPNWQGFFNWAKTIYKGTLSYAAWGGEPGQGGVVFGSGCTMPVSPCGITFYPDMSLGSSPTVAQLTHAMETDLTSRMTSSELQNLEIDEMGIPATPVGYGKPWDWNLSGPRNDQVQANWFTAACTAVQYLGMRGLLLWEMPMFTSGRNPVGVNPAASPEANNIMTGRPAVTAAIQSCAKGTPGR